MDAKQRIKDKLRSAYNREDRIEIAVEDIGKRRFADATPIAKWEIREAFYRNPGEYKWIDEKWRPIGIGDPWGGEDKTGFFRARVRVPARFKGKPLALKIRIGGEALLKIDGEPFQGLDIERDIVFIAEKSTGAEAFRVEIEAYVRQMFEEQVTHTLAEASIVSIDREMEEIYFDFRVAFDVAQLEKISDELRMFLVNHIEDAMKLVDPYETDAAKYLAGAKRARQHCERPCTPPTGSRRRAASRSCRTATSTLSTCGRTASSSARSAVCTPRS